MNENNETQSAPLMLDITDSTRTEVTIAGLQPESYYLIQTAAYTRKGDGEKSKPRRVKTKGAGEEISNCLV